MFLREDGRVLKLFRDPAHGDRAEREAAALTVLAAAGVDAPAAPERVDVDGRPGLVMDRVDGADLLARVGDKPWLVWPAAAVMANAHLAMHAVEAPRALPQLNDELRVQIETAATGPLDQGMADFALRVLSQLPQGDRLCHGDFHLGNILGTFAAPVIIDWGNASRGDPLADVARTELLHRYGELPPAAPPLLRAVAKIGRGIVVSRYRRTYRKRTPVDAATLKRWAVVRAAARFADGIESEYEPLTTFLTRARARS